jgi:hypothetical protein
VLCFKITHSRLSTHILTFKLVIYVIDESGANLVCQDSLCAEFSRILRTGSVNARPSDGQLNKDFKFGGNPSAPAEMKEKDSATNAFRYHSSFNYCQVPLRNVIAGDESIFKSIFAKAVEIPLPLPLPLPSRVRLNSYSNSKRTAHTTARTSYVPSHYRRSPELSLADFDSFMEVRRGFEFHDNRPNFYPPPETTSRGKYIRRESMFSIASILSYGQVINNGSIDPFDYGAIASAPLGSLRERP